MVKFLNSFIKSTEKKTSVCSISMYQRPVTDIKGRMYHSIAGGIIVQIIPSVFHVKLAATLNRQMYYPWSIARHYVLTLFILSFFSVAILVPCPPVYFFHFLFLIWFLSWILREYIKHQSRNNADERLKGQYVIRVNKTQINQNIVNQILHVHLSTILYNRDL